jgi:hypothetical protein
MADAFQPRFVDLVRNYTTTTGTGNFVLGTEVQGYRSFHSEIQAGESFYYSAIGIDKQNEFEVGRGRMEADGTISRDPIGGTFTSFGNGTKSVALVAAAEWYENIGSGTAATPSTAGTRSELAALTNVGRPALLTESGRGGLFVFDPSDLSAKVEADTGQGIYVAPASDPSGASGAWTRAYSGPIEARWFGAVGDGISDDTAAIQAALTHFETAGPGVLRLGSGTFEVTGTLLNFSSELTIDARGATVEASATSSGPILFIGGTGVRILGGTWKVAYPGSRQIDVEGLSCHLDKCLILHDPPANTVQMYVRYGANGFKMTNCRMAGANEAIFVEASDVLIMGNDFESWGKAGGDDCIAIKAIQGITENIRIIGNKCRYHANIAGIGSALGTLGADDPSFSRRVRGVAIIGNTLEACANLVLIKPGAEAKDYRNGVVEAVRISDNSLYDPAGEVFERGIAIMASRGAIVRDIKGRGNTIVARASETSSTGHKMGMEILAPNAGAAPRFEDIDVGFTFNDPYDGAPQGTAGVPGYPIASIVNIEDDNENGSTLRDIRINVVGNGCAAAGIRVYSGLDDCVTIDKAVLSNVNTAGAEAGIHSDSRIAIANSNQVSIEVASGNPYSLGTSGEIVANVDHVFLCEQINPGVDEIRRPWAAPRRGFLTKVELLQSNAIARSQDDTNYTQFEFRNIGGTANVFHKTSSKLTGGQAFPAETYNTVLDVRSVSAGNRPDCLFDPGSQLYVYKNDFGTGNVILTAYLRVHWAPY